LDQVEGQDGISLVDVEAIIKKLMKEYRIAGKEEANVINLSDYLQRMRGIISRKKNN